MYDHIVVGAGTSGCIIAGRLSQAGRRVLLIEAGADMPPGGEPAAVRHPFPQASSNPAYFWPGLMAQTGAAIGDAPGMITPYPQARVVGGGSTINGALALRGTPQDYDGWQAMGADGWGWHGVLPFFTKLERDLDCGGPQHGRDGPLPIRRTPRRDWGGLTQAIVAALEARGYAELGDLNAMFGDGFGAVPVSNLPDRRVSTAAAYLDAAARKRPNLRILADTTVTRLRRHGRRITGVDVVTLAGAQSFDAQEVILCGGTIHSAAMLLAAGIGPAAHLRSIGIDVVADRPGVGANLQNHCGMYVPMHLRSAARQVDRHLIWSQAMLRYSSRHPGCEQSDMTLFVVGRGGWHPLGGRMGAVSASIFKTASRGTVSLGTDHRPQVNFRLMSDERDMARMVQGVQTAFAVLADPQVRAMRNEVVMPPPAMVQRLAAGTATARALSAALNAVLAGPGIVRRRLLADIALDVDLLARDPGAAREFAMHHARPPGHVTGTCRIGAADDPGAVIDPRCRVIGVEGLRVADGSIMPHTVRANTNLPIAMIGEKAAAIILDTA